MGPTGDFHRVLQIHPTRRCNLRCLHCYSTSGPEEKAQLSVDLLRGALNDAQAEGYNVAGFSGGEPVLYKPLRRLLEHAKSCGMLTTVTSNGMLLDSRRLNVLEGPLDLLAISLDGMPESHNRMRGSDRAFGVMLARLEGVRQSGIPFGFIFTLTQDNVQELEWAAAFAVAQGARLLQIHPLENVGRATEMLPQSRPDPIRAAHAFVRTERIRSIAGHRLHVQIDLVHQGMIEANPERVFAVDMRADEADRPLGSLVSPLVVEADGTVVPVRHGFARQFALGNLHDAPLVELSARWRSERLASFRELCCRVFTEVTTPKDLPFVNWYDVIGNRAGAVVAGA